MTKSVSWWTGCTADHDGDMIKINERPGVAVCICRPDGVIVRHDPGMYLRELREQYARMTREKEENEDDAD